MDFNQIKNLVKRSGNTLILMEEGQPEVVVMPFGAYSRMADAAVSAAEPSDRPINPMTPMTEEHLDAAPGRGLVREADDEAGTEFFADDRHSARPPHLARLADIRLEDLPL